MDHTPYVVSALVAALSSSGMWGLIQYILSKRSNTQTLLLGIAQRQIVAECEKYLDRGYIYTEEYQDLLTYLYAPYIDNGGNGYVTKLISEIDKLEVRTRPLTRGGHYERTKPR